MHDKILSWGHHVKKDKSGLVRDLEKDRPAGSTDHGPVGSSAYFPIENHELAAAASTQEATGEKGRASGWTKAFVGILALAALSAAAVGASRSARVREVLSAPLTLSEVRERATAIIQARQPASAEMAVPVLDQNAPGVWNATLQNFRGPRTLSSNCQPCMATARNAALDKLPPELAEEVRQGQRQLYEIALTPQAVSNEANDLYVSLDGHPLTKVHLAVETPRSIVVPLRVGKRSELVFSKKCPTCTGGPVPCKLTFNMLNLTPGETPSSGVRFDSDGRLATEVLIAEPVTRKIASVANKATQVVTSAPSYSTPSENSEIDYEAAPPAPPVPAAPAPTCPKNVVLDD